LGLYTKGTYFTWWWRYVAHRRAKLAKLASARDLHENMTTHLAFVRWADNATRAAAQMSNKVAAALEFAFGKSVAFVLAKWQGLTLVHVSAQLWHFLWDTLGA